MLREKREEELHKKAFGLHFLREAIVDIVTIWAHSHIFRSTYKMGTLTKIILASICVAFLAVKWTSPTFDEGKRNSTARGQGRRL